MSRLLSTIALAVAATVAAPAFASPQSEALGSCLTDHTTGKDRKDLARWIFVAMAAHPAIHDLSAVPPGQLDRSNRDTAAMFTRLLATDCPNETRAAIQAGGPEAIKDAFTILGQMAMQELMRDKQVQTALSGLDRYIDHDKLNTLLAPH